MTSPSLPSLYQVMRIDHVLGGRLIEAGGGHRTTINNKNERVRSFTVGSLNRIAALFVWRFT